MRKFLEFIEKRDGKTVKFDHSKIETAIDKAIKVVGKEGNQDTAKNVADKVIHSLKKKYGYNTPKVEEVQDTVEQALIAAGLVETA